jgi:radical SAM protein with 4Fe4S-binding SPASM domain
VEKKLKMIHFQLTSRCNLHCVFCGQWGDNGFMKTNHPPDDMQFSVWKKAIDSIVAACPDELPKVSLWGGEPLLYDDFDRLLKYLYENGFKTGVVTNGTLLAEHADVINDCVDTLYISIDGPPEMHDKIRGRSGLFDEIRSNMDLISDTVFKVGMCFFSKENYKILPQLPFAIQDVNIDKLLIQNLIFSTSKDIACYKNWLKQNFSQEGTHVDSWCIDNHGDYIEELPDVIRQIQSNIAAGAYPLQVEVLPEGMKPDNIKKWYLAEDGIADLIAKNDYCLAPFNHLHIKPQGDVHYCVDFDDFTAGNIKENDIMDIFNNEISERFRKEIVDGRNSLCKRCPWRFNADYKLDGV